MSISASNGLRAILFTLLAVAFYISVGPITHAQEIPPVDTTIPQVTDTTTTTSTTIDTSVSTDTTTSTTALTSAVSTAISTSTLQPIDTSVAATTSQTELSGSTTTASAPVQENAPNISSGSSASMDSTSSLQTSSSTDSLLVVATSSQVAAVATTLPSPTLTTDKADYHPGETATIFGKFFQSLQNVVLEIVGRDSNGNTIVTNAWAVSADTDGGFTTQYTLPDTYVPLYLLAANSSTGEVLAETSFTDSVSVMAATGGTSVSADKAANASSPAWTTLGPITVSEGAGSPNKGDFSIGTNITLILKAPTGFEFNTAITPNITKSGSDITSASVVVTDASTITVTLTVGATASNDSFTVGGTTGIQTRPTLGIPLSAGQIYRPTSGGGTALISGITTTANLDGSAGTNFGTLTEVVGVANKLAFNQQPANAVSGTNISPAITVRIVDQFGNPTTSTASVSLAIGTNPSGGILNGGTAVAAVVGVATFSSANIKNVGTGYTLTAASTGLTGATSNAFNIAQRAITVTAATNSKAYDGLTTAAAIPTITSGTLATGDTSAFTESYSIKTVAAGKTLVPAGVVTDGNSGANYLVTFVNNATGVITAKSLTVTGVTASNKVYDATTAATLNTGSATLVGVISGDTVSVTPATGTGTFASASVGTSVAVSVSGITLSGTDAGNYTLTQPSAITANITAKPTTATLTANDKTYDKTNAATISSCVLSGVIAADVANVNCTGSSATFASVNANASAQVVTATVTLGGTASGNYSVTTPVTTTAKINPKAITVTAAANTKTYDRTTSAAGTPTITSGGPLLTGDTSSFTETYSTATTGTSKTLTPAGTVTDGNSGNNYTITFSPIATGVINAKALTVTGVTAVNKVYDANTSATLNFAGATLVGIISPDVVTINSTSALGAFADKNVGTSKTITVTGVALAGADAGNYSVTQPSGVTANITTATLTYTANAASRAYAATSPAFSGTVTGFLGTDTQANSTTGTLAFTTSATGTSVPGTYPINGGGLTSTNYTFAQAAGNASALTITKANQTISVTTAAPTTAAFNSTFPVVATSNSGLSVLITTTGVCTISSGTVTMNSGTGTCNIQFNQAGDANYNSATQVASVTTATKKAQTITFASIGTKTYGAADFTVSATSDSGLSVSFSSQTTAVCTVTGTTVHLLSTGTCKVRASQAGDTNYSAASDLDRPFTITPKSIPASVTASNKTYDGTNAATIASCTPNGLVNSDVVTCSALAATFSDKNFGVGKTVTATGITLAGSNASNYTLSSGTAGTIANIAKLSITVTAATNSKQYDGTTTAAATPTVTTGAIQTGDTGVFSENYATASVGTGKTLTPVGTVTDGNSGNNYNVTFANNTTGVITPISVTASVVAANKTYDGNTTASLTSCTVSGALPADTANVTCAASGATFADENVGTAKIVTATGITLAGTLAGNYSVNTSATTNADISTKDINVVVDTGQSKVFSQIDPTLTATKDALVGTDSYSGELHRAVGENVGTYVIDQGTLSAGTNYTIHFIGANFAITAKPITVTANAGQTKVFGATDPALTSTSSDLVPAFTGSLSRATGENVGSYTISQGSLDAGTNYAITFVADNFAITKATSTTVVTCPASVTYTAAAETPCTAAVTGASGLTTTATVIYTSNISAGTAHASATFAGDANHTGSSDTKDFTIDKKALTITASASDKVYDATTAASATLANDAVAGDSIDVTNTGATFSDKNVGTAKTVTVSFTVTGASAGNYISTASPVTATASISAKPLTITAVTNTKVYDTNSSALATPSSTGLEGSDTVTATESYDTAAAGTGKSLSVDAGYVVNDGNSGNNYTTTTNSVTTGVITKATATIDITNIAETFDGTTKSVTTETTPTGLAVDVTYDAVTTAPTNAGTYAVVATINDSNYSGSSNASLVISKAASATVITCPATLQTFTGSAIAPCSASVTGAGALTTTSPVTYAANTNVGTATADASFAGDVNHNPSTATQSTFTITAKPITVTADVGQTKVFGQPDAAFTYTSSDPAATFSGALSRAGGQNVGSYAIDQGTLSAGTNYAITFVPDDFVITKATATCTIVGSTTTYDAASHGASGTCAGVAGADLTSSVTLGYAFTTVPGGTAHWTFTNANYIDHSGDATITISKADPIILMTPYAVTFDGAPHTATGSATGISGEILTGLDLSVTTHTSAGDYSADAWTFTDSTGNYNSPSGTTHDEISKAVSSTVVTCPTTPQTFTGLPLTPCNASVTGIGGLTDTATVTYATSTNVGTAGASAIFAGDANHDGSTGSSTFTISKADSTTLITCPTSVVYNGSAQSPCTATVTGAGGLNQSVTVTHANNTNAGTATANAAFDGDSNHNASNALQNSFEITKANAVIVVTPYSVTFDGLAHTATAIATGVHSDDLSNLFDLSGTTHTNAGTYTGDAWSFSGNSNYNIDSGTVNDAVEKAASATAITCPANVTYTGAALTPCSVSVTGAGSLPLTPDPVYAANTDAGTASASYTFSGDDNHTGSSDSKNFAIDKASSATVITCSTSEVFTGSPITPCTAAVTGAGGLNTTADVTYTDNTNVGPAKAHSIYAGDNNHNGSTATDFTFAITKAASQTVVTCSPKTLVYIGLAQTPCTTVITGVGGLSQTPTPTYTDNTHVGTATANYTFAGDANHNGSHGSDTFAITKASAICTIAGYTNKYDGTPHGATGLCKGVKDETLTGLILGATFTNVPGGTAHWIFTDTTGNYENDAGDVTIAISKADPLILVTTYAVSYNAASHVAIGSATGVNSEILTGLDLSATTHTAAGTYPTDAWTFTDTTGNYNDKASTVTDSISKVDPTCFVTKYSVTYDATSHAATGTCAGIGADGNLAGLDLAATSHTNAGTYNADAWTFTDVSGNYNNKNGTIDDAISKANAVISLTPYSVTYDGTPHTATGSAKGIESTSPVNLSTLLHFGGTTHTNAGTYATDAWSFEGNDNYISTNGIVSDVIHQVSSITAITCPVSVTYTGLAQTPCTAAVTGVGGLSTTTSVTYNANTNVGTASAHASYTGDNNHAASSATDSTFAIAKADSSTVVSCPATALPYTGLAQTPCTVSVTGPGGLSLAPTPTYASNTNAGVASASYTYAGDTNHNGSSASKNFTISKVNATCTVSGFSGIYDATAHGATGSCTGVGTDGVLAGLVLGSSFTNVPGGSAHWTFTGGTNYNDQNGDANIVINKATAIVSVTPYSVTFDGSAHTATGSASGIAGANLNASLLLSGTTHTNAGDYATDAWSFTGGTNYNNANGTVHDVIGQATSTTTVSCPVSVTFNAAAQTPCTAAVTGVALSLSPTPTYLNNTNAGSASAAYTFAGEINHTGSTNSKNFTISKASPTIVVTPYSAAYDALAHTGTGSAKGILNENLTGLTLGSTTHTNAGTYPTDAWTFTDVTGNYNNANGTVADSIGKVAASVTPSAAGKQYSDLDPTLTGALSGFILADGITAAYSRTAGENPGTYALSATLSPASALGNYTITYNTASFTIGKENTAIAYTGDTFVISAGPTITTAPIQLSAKLTQEVDGYPGNIALAKVTFVLTPLTGPQIIIPDILVNASGDALTSKVVPVGEYAITVNISAGNGYWQSAGDTAALEVTLGSADQRVTGGGWISDALSRNGKDNFGFTVNYNKSGAPKGNFLFMFRGKDGYDYQLKSNSWANGGMSFNGTNGAYFAGKATLSKIDQLTGLVISSDGSYTFSANIKDGDQTIPKTADTFALTIFNSAGGVWKQLGTSAAQINLGGGNVVVQSK